MWQRECRVLGANHNDSWTMLTDLWGSHDQVHGHKTLVLVGIFDWILILLLNIYPFQSDRKWSTLVLNIWMCWQMAITSSCCQSLQHFCFLKQYHPFWNVSTIYVAIYCFQSFLKEKLFMIKFFSFFNIQIEN